MQAGALKKRITIEQQVRHQDEYGELVNNWGRVCTVWASVEPLQGREFLEARGQEAQVTTRMRTRFREDIKPSMRVIFNGRTYLIDSVIDVKEAGRELQLICRELVAE